MTIADQQAKSMSLIQLAMIWQDAPPLKVAWTPLERAARDEYDRRIIALEDALR